MFDRGASNQEISFLSALIVPLPSGIALGGFMAERNAATLFAAWHKQLNVPPVPQPLLRTYLQPSNRLKARLTADTGLPAEFRRELRSHLMPKWVWVTEYADRSEFLSNGTCVGLLIADSASHPTCSDFMDIVALHVPGSLCLVGTNASVLPRIVSVPATVGIPILRRDPCCS